MEMTSQRDIHRVSPACAIPDLAGEITAALVGTGPALGLGEVRSTSAPSRIALVIGTSGTTGMSKEVSMMLATGLIGNVQSAARHWLERDQKISREEAVVLVSGQIWRGISGFPRHD